MAHTHFVDVFVAKHIGSVFVLFRHKRILYVVVFRLNTYLREKKQIVLLCWLVVDWQTDNVRLHLLLLFC